LVVFQHVSLAYAYFRVGVDFDSEPFSDCDPFAVNAFNHPAHGICHPFFVKQEIPISLDACRIGQAYCRMDHGVRVLQAGLDHIFRCFHAWIYIGDQSQNIFCVPPGQRCQEVACFQFQKHMNPARLTQADRVVQGMGFGDPDGIVLQFQPGRALEGECAATRTRADDYGLSRLQFSGYYFPERLRAESRADHVNKLGCFQRTVDIVTGVGNAAESRNISFGVNPALFSNCHDVAGELREVESRKD